MALFILCALAGLALGYRRLMRIPASTAFLQIFALVILVLFLAGLIGILRWAAGGIILLGAVLLIVETLRRLRDRSPDLPVPAGIFLILALIFWLLHGHSQFFFYDEYAHWGVFLRDMLADNGFWGAQTNSMHPRYLPGPTLFQYLFSTFLDATDGIAYFAQFCLLIAPLLILWEGLKWSQIGWMAGVLALCLVVLFDFGHGITSLYVDHVLGTWFVGTLLCYVRQPETRLARLIPYAACLGTLALIKDSGLYFALAGAGIIALLALQQRVVGDESLGKAARSSVAAFALMALVGIAVTQAWNHNREVLHVAEDVMSSEGIALGLMGKQTAVSPETRAEISRRFLDIFFHQQLSKSRVSWNFNEYSFGIKDLFTDSFRLTTFSLLALCAVWFSATVAWLIDRSKRWLWSLLYAGVFATTIGYLLILYAAYMFAFGDDGLRVPSYIRYVHSAALPLVILAFAPLVPAFADHLRVRVLTIGRDSIRVGTVAFLLGLTGLYVFERPFLAPAYRSNPEVQFRAQSEAWFRDIRPIVGRDRVWVFLPVDKPNGFFGRVLSYTMSPTPAFIERSDAFIDRPDDEILDEWSRYDYLWFPFQSEDLDKMLERLSDGPLTSRLFRVEKDNQGQVRLVPVPVLVEDHSSG